VNVLAFDLSLTATGVAHPDGTADTLQSPFKASQRAERLV